MCRGGRGHPELRAGHLREGERVRGGLLELGAYCPRCDKSTRACNDKSLLKAVKVFKFKKYKEGYEDENWCASPRYPLEIGDFCESQGWELPVSSVVPAPRLRALFQLLPRQILWHRLPQGRYASNSSF